MIEAIDSYINLLVALLPHVSNANWLTLLRTAGRTALWRFWRAV